jgi:hypothetical protein
MKLFCVGKRNYQREALRQGEIQMSVNENAPASGAAIDFEAGRRAFLRTAGLATAGAAVLGITGLPSTAEAQTISDASVLNFALNLEYLEAEFYLRAIRGTGLTNSQIQGTGTLGPVRQAVEGQSVPFTTQAVREYAIEIASDEENHVNFLRSALGASAVARPPIDLDSSFSAAALAAGLIQPGGTFNPFENENNFLLGAFIFEDVGVTAYKGAARFISNKDTLEAAAGILAVEAYHAGIIRTILFQRGFIDAANRISQARDNVAGTAVDQGITVSDPASPMAGQANLVPTDRNSVAFSRTPQQVLNVVYLGSAPSAVSFFPIGVNGDIR